MTILKDCVNSPRLNSDILVNKYRLWHDKLLGWPVEIINLAWLIRVVVWFIITVAVRVWKD